MSRPRGNQSAVNIADIFQAILYRDAIQEIIITYKSISDKYFDRLHIVRRHLGFFERAH